MFCGQVNYGVSGLNAAVWSGYIKRSIKPSAGAARWKSEGRVREPTKGLTGSVSVLSFSRN